MVDATASRLTPARRHDAARPDASEAPAFDVSVQSRLEEYLELCRNAVFAPPQDPDWVAAWLRNLRPDAVVAVVRQQDQLVFGLALEIQARGPLRIARLVGGGHANGNFPPMTADLAVSHHQACVATLIQALKRARPDIDILEMERMAPTHGKIANPLLTLPHMTSPNIALAVDLNGGFQSVLKRLGTSTKPKRHRYKARKLAAAGTVRRLRAATPEQARSLLETFFSMKERRLKRLGVRDVFGDDRIRAFFSDLFAKAAADDKPAFMLDALEVGGKVRAVTGSSRNGGRLLCDFAAIAEDELSPLGLGDFLFFENIAAACDEGFAVYDFGVGDEPYKRGWCDIEIHHFDVWAPLTMRGRIYAALMRGKSKLKTAIKRSPVAWRIMKALRTRLLRREAAS